MNTIQCTIDPHTQLRALYMSLLTRQENFDEFKQLLAMYEVPPERMDHEPLDADLTQMGVGGHRRGAGVRRRAPSSGSPTGWRRRRVPRRDAPETLAR